MDDPAIAAKVWESLAQAVQERAHRRLRAGRHLGSVQRPLITSEPIPLHGGDEPSKGC
jgi:hypothetical protein